MTLPSTAFHTGADPRYAGGRTTIDLAALAQNWQYLDALNGSAETGASVKADCYGLGMEPVCAALFEAGCRSFFVALPEEGLNLRHILRSYQHGATADIYVLSGPVGGRDAVMACIEGNLIAVLNSPKQIALWQEQLSLRSAFQNCAIHHDTGMNRLGLSDPELHALVKDEALMRKLNACLFMTHMACADDREHPLNAEQLKRFQLSSRYFHDTRLSLANSASHFLGPAYHFDLTRPGIALYGGECQAAGVNPMQPVVTVETRIVQIRDAKKGESVGYGATHTFEKDTRIATCNTGYADGYHRAASGSGVGVRSAITEGARVAIGSHTAPVLGRVSMDMIAVDVSNVPEDVIATTEWVELFGKTVLVDDVARACGTIGYELLTSMSPRNAVTYLPPKAD